MPAASARSSARAPALVADATAHDRQARVDQRLQVRALAADEDADHTSLPDHGACAGIGGRHDRAASDPEVEDPPLLLLGDAARRATRDTGGRSHGVPVELDADAVGQHAREVAEDPAAGDVRERLHVGPRRAARTSSR